MEDTRSLASRGRQRTKTQSKGKLNDILWGGFMEADVGFSRM